MCRYRVARHGWLGFAAFLVLVASGVAIRSSTPAPLSGYQVVHGWPVMPPGITLGAVSGVSVDPRGDVVVFRRADRQWLADDPDTLPIADETVFRFDARTGRLLGSWGERRFPMPHGLTVDRGGHIWLTDVALHQVFEFDSAGRSLLVLGERGVPGADHAHFNRPTAVAVAPDGSFYVSDGYRNTRVVKFSAEGRFLLQWGQPGSGPGEFRVPHGIALDARGRVYVADRGNARVQVFDSTGRFLSQWSGPAFGRPWAIAVAPDQTLFVVDGGDQPDSMPDRARILHVDPDGHVLGAFGRFGRYDGQFDWPHDVAVGSDGAVYVGDIRGGRVQQFRPVP